MPDSSPKAFVIMPFDSEFQAVYTDLIKPSLENSGYEVTRADSLMNQQNILKDIVRQIAKADLIVAELTALNPNVFYELGIAHALRKRTLLITQSIEELPFDLRSYRVISYSTLFDEIGRLSDSLTAIAQKANTLEFGNPVIDFLQAENLTQQLPGNKINKIGENDQMDSDEEKGLWDYALEAEGGLGKATVILLRLNDAITDIGRKMTDRTQEVELIKKSGPTGLTAKMYRLAELAAIEIQDFAQKIESELPEYRTAWENFSESTTSLIRTSMLKTPEDLGAGQQFKILLKTLSDQIAGSISSMKQFRESHSQLRGISKSMNRATRKSTAALDRVLSEFEKSLSYTSKVTDLLDEMIMTYENEHSN